MPVFRTKDELKRAQWADRYMSVTEGKQYVFGENGSTEGSPFPFHEYLKNEKLGKKVRMCEVNAGHAAVENMVADTMTDLTIQLGEGESENKAIEQEFREWMDSEEVDYLSKLEESCRDFYGVGYCVQQPFRTEEKSDVLIGTVEPATWYPTIPTFTYQNVTEGKIISVFDEGTGGVQEWYAFVETHTVGRVEYALYKLDRPDSLEGTSVALSKIKRFAGLKDTETGLDYLAVFQRNRKKSTGHLFGQSVLFPIWDILQEVSEIQTQIRQERIKHLRSKMYGDSRSFQRAENVPVNSDPAQQNHSKAVAAAEGAYKSLNQDILPVAAGGIVPGYIQRDLSAITVGSEEIDKLLNRAAMVAGLPRNVFNLDEKGEVHEGTDRRKHRPYVRQIIQGQKQMAWQLKKAFTTWWVWKKSGDVKKAPAFNGNFANPFGLSQLEVAEMMREMNPDVKMVSQKEAVKQAWPDMKPEDRDKMLADLEEEAKLTEPPPNSALNRLQPVQL